MRGIHTINDTQPFYEGLLNSKPFILLLIVLCFPVNFSGLCASEGLKTGLTVKNITFALDKGGGETIKIFCNQSCTPTLFSLDEENPRVVMDMKGVSLIQTKTRNVNTGGALVKRIRSYLDKQSRILRVVLYMEPSKYYTVRPIQNPSGNTYVLKVDEVVSPSEQMPGGRKDAKGSLPLHEKRITILRPALRPGEQEGERKEASLSPGKRRTVKAAKDTPLKKMETESLSVNVKNITFKVAGDGKELLFIEFDRFYTPTISRIEGSEPRIILEIKNASSLREDWAVINAGGNFIRQIRSSMDSQTRAALIVIDIAPGKDYFVSQAFYKKENVYSLAISEKEEVRLP